MASTVVVAVVAAQLIGAAVGAAVDVSVVVGAVVVGAAEVAQLVGAGAGGDSTVMGTAYLDGGVAAGCIVETAFPVAGFSPKTSKRTDAMTVMRIKGMETRSQDTRLRPCWQSALRRKVNRIACHTLTKAMLYCPLYVSMTTWLVE
jgi:hypothetical protein